MICRASLRLPPSHGMIGFTGSWLLAPGSWLLVMWCAHRSSGHQKNRRATVEVRRTCARSDSPGLRGKPVGEDYRQTIVRRGCRPERPGIFHPLNSAGKPDNSALGDESWWLASQGHIQDIDISVHSNAGRKGRKNLGHELPGILHRILAHLGGDGRFLSRKLLPGQAGV